MMPDVEQVAAEWLARRFAGLTPAEEHEFQRWRAAHPRHAAVYGELEATWRDLDRVRLPIDAAGAPDPDVLAPRRVRRSLGWWLPAIAAAAAAVVAVGLYSGWMGNRFSTPGRLERPYVDVVTTAVGDLQKLDLPDGSIVHLNTDSRVEIAFSVRERRVRLQQGEAHFTVAKNPARPFFVEAGGIAVRAVGTAFNVRLRAEAVEVLVTEGRVQVAGAAREESALVASSSAASSSSPLLSAGERVVIPTTAAAQGRAVAVPSAEIERALAWQNRRIDALAVPLTELVAEFNRYNRQKLALADAELGARRFGGSFRVDDPETFVRLLATRFGLRVERRGEVIVLCP